jgi:transcriptional regulator with XRE-family HTH domain
VTRAIAKLGWRDLVQAVVLAYEAGIVTTDRDRRCCRDWRRRTHRPGNARDHRQSDILMGVEPGALIKAVRRRQGLTQAALARRAGTSQPVISAYEHGRRDPSYDTLRRIVDAGGERLQIDAVPLRTDLPPPADPEEHARRLLDVLSLSDAIPARRRSAVLKAPRMVSA